MARIDSFHQSVLQCLDVLDEFVPLWSELKVLRAVGELESVQVAEM